MGELNPLSLLRNNRIGNTIALSLATVALAPAVAAGKIINSQSSLQVKSSSEQVATPFNPDSLTADVVNSILPASEAGRIVTKDVDLSDNAFNADGVCTSPTDPNIMTYTLSGSLNINQNCDGTFGVQPDPSEVQQFPTKLGAESNKIVLALGLANNIEYPVEFSGVTSQAVIQPPSATLRFACPPSSDANAANFRSAVIIDGQGNGIEDNCPTDQPITGGSPVVSAPSQISRKLGSIPYQMNIPGRTTSTTVDLVSESSGLQLQKAGSKPSWHPAPGVLAEWNLPGANTGQSSEANFNFKLSSSARLGGKVCATMLIKTTNENSEWIRTNTYTDQECTTVVNPKPLNPNSMIEPIITFRNNMFKDGLASINDIKRLTLSARHLLIIYGCHDSGLQEINDIKTPRSAGEFEGACPHSGLRSVFIPLSKLGTAGPPSLDFRFILKQQSDRFAEADGLLPAQFGTANSLTYISNPSTHTSTANFIFKGGRSFGGHNKVSKLIVSAHKKAVTARVR